jgi:RNA polymerase sigma-70 factor (ECF subfamily)
VTIPTGPRHRISRVEAHGGVPAPRPDQGSPPRDDTDLGRLLALVARGDQDAFETLYDRLSGPAFGLVRKVLRDPAQSEEVTQEVMLEVWRSASRFDPDRGSATTWALTIAHRRAVDRVRSEAASAEREQRSAPAPSSVDDVAETVEASLDAEQVRRCLDGLSELQREAITLAYYGGYTYPQVARKLEVALGTVKTRIRDGLTRLGNCLGRSW